MIKHDGIIIALNEDGTALVRIVQTSACAACKAKAMCASAESAEKEMTVQLVQRSSKAQSAVQDGSKLSSEKTTTLNNVEQPLNNVEPKNEEAKA